MPYPSRLSLLLVAMLLGALFLALVGTSSSYGRSPEVSISNEVIFTPPSNYTDPRVLYARTAELSDGTLLATWENYSPEPPLVYFPIYRSVDQGQSWAMISKVTDQVNGWGLRYQPFLYELPRGLGGFAAGTVLCAGNSIPTDLSKTQIDIYASTDKGLTWKFVSHVATGGKAQPNNGLTPIWKPFLMLYQDQIILYYSDQRDSSHGQKLVQQVSRDLLRWDAPVDDVAYGAYTARPGMSTVAPLPSGKFIMTYEYGGWPGFSSYSFPLYCRISDNPLAFNASAGQPIAVGSTRPQSSPYVVWSSVGGKNGTIIVSSGTNQELYVNRALGEVGKWEILKNVPQPAGYTRHLRVLRGDPSSLVIMGAGHLPPSTTNFVSLSVMNLGKALG